MPVTPTLVTNEFTSVTHELCTATAVAIAAGRVVYRSSGAIAVARANAVGTARKLVGVTTTPISASGSGYIQRSGAARVLADSSCSPVLDAPAYLSSEAGGKVASSINGTVVPRMLGTFAESAVAADGTVLVWLILDDARDDAREWLIDDFRPSVETDTHDLNITAALWQYLRFDGRGLVKTGETITYQPRIDGSTGTGYFQANSYGGPSASNYPAMGSTNSAGSFLAAQVWFSGGNTCLQWAMPSTVTPAYGTAVALGVPATSIGILTYGGIGFPANTCRLQTFGRLVTP